VCHAEYIRLSIIFLLVHWHGTVICQSHDCLLLVISEQLCFSDLTHAHASFISTTTKPLPDSATNTDYDTLTMTAFTTTPICNLCHPWADVLPFPSYLNVSQWFFSSKLVLKAVESCFVALNYYGDGSSCTSFQQD
jgi:hypothetical protein